MLLLTMVVAIVLAAAVQAVRGLQSAGEARMFVPLGAIVGVIAGFVVALTRCRWWLAILLGVPAGLVIGLVIGGLMVVPACLPVLLAGCPLIVLYAVAVRYLSRPKDQSSVSSDGPPPPPMTVPPPPVTVPPPPMTVPSASEPLPDARPSRLDRPWGARWDTPAAGVPRRFGVGVLMLFVTLAAVLFSALRSMGACPEVFAVIATMFAAVAVGQMFLFGGRYPRAASIWVGGCFFPLQVIAGCVGMYFGTGGRSVPSLDEEVGRFVLLLLSIPLGTGFGYLTGGLVGGVFLALDALDEKRRQSQREAVEAAEPPAPTEER